MISGIGALVGGLFLYLIVAGFGGGVDWETRFTFDQGSELELEGIAIFAGIVLGAMVGAPIGAFIALQSVRAPAAITTAVALVLPSALGTALAMWIIPSGPDDPVLAPFGVFGVWFLASYLIRRAVEKRR